MRPRAHYMYMVEGAVHRDHNDVPIVRSSALCKSCPTSTKDDLEAARKLVHGVVAELSALG